MRLSINSLVLYSVALLFINGCVTRVEMIDAPHPEPTPGEQVQGSGGRNEKPVADKRIVIDPALQNIIRVIKVTATNAPNGFLKVQLNVRNMTDSVQSFGYRLDWFDESGNALPMAESTLLPWTLLKRETSFLALGAPTPAARNFRATFVAPGKP